MARARQKPASGGRCGTTHSSPVGPEPQRLGSTKPGLTPATLVVGSTALAGGEPSCCGWRATSTAATRWFVVALDPGLAGHQPSGATGKWAGHRRDQRQWRRRGADLVATSRGCRPSTEQDAIAGARRGSLQSIGRQPLLFGHVSSNLERDLLVQTGALKPGVRRRRCTAAMDENNRSNCRHQARFNSSLAAAAWWCPFGMDCRLPLSLQIRGSCSDPSRQP